MSTIKHPVQRRRSTYTWYPMVEGGLVTTALIALVVIPAEAMTPLAIAYIAGAVIITAMIRLIAAYADSLEPR